MIWGLGLLLALAAIAGLTVPWWRASFTQRAALRRRTANVVAYQGRLAELESDVQAGVLPVESVEGTRQELAARLLEDTTDASAAPALAAKPAGPLLIGLAVSLVAFAAAWYALAGSWRTQALLDLAKTNPELAQARAVDLAIERLRERVAGAPGDADAWLALGRSYGERGNFADAAQAIGRASELKASQDPDVLVEHGEALALVQNRSLAGAPAEKFAQALALAPEHPRALWFAGIAAFQAGNPPDAIKYWERLLAQELPEDTRTTLEHSLAMLRERAGLPAAPPSARPPAEAAARPAPAPPVAAAGPVALRISVSLAPGLAGAVGSSDALFVFAQDAAGPPMPLAVQRLSAGQLPAEVTLDDGDSMTPERTLSSASRWRLVARISRTGNAAAQPGDLEGSVEVGRADAGKPVKLVIDRRR
jgi:cytochrome c-type biogenesis protein CcmH